MGRLFGRDSGHKHVWIPHRMKKGEVQVKTVTVVCVECREVRNLEGDDD